MNRVVLIGRLTADPELRHTQSGTSVTSYRLAVDRPIKAEGQPSADFINCVAWGNAADFASKYLHKGTKIGIEGRISTGSYEKDDGSKVYTFYVVVERHEFCESKSGYSSITQAAEAPANYGASGGGSAFADYEEDDGDLPF